MLKDDTEGIGTPIQVAGLLSHIDGRSGSFDGIAALVKRRIKGLDENGDFTLVIEVGKFLQAEGILVLDPRFDGRTTVIVPGIGGILIAVLERQDNARNGTSIDAEVGYVNLQYICSLIIGIGRVIGELGIENDVVLRLVILELDGTRSKVISCTVEHSRISIECPGRRPR